MPTWLQELLNSAPEIASGANSVIYGEQITQNQQQILLEKEKQKTTVIYAGFALLSLIVFVVLWKKL